MSKKAFQGEKLQTLIREYKSGKSSKRLSEKYGVSGSCIIGTLKKNGVRIRTMSEAHKFREMSGKNNPNYGKGLFGEKNPNWQGGKKYLYYSGSNQIGAMRKKDRAFRKYIKTLDNNKCVLCGSKEMLEIHHIIPWVEDENKRFDENNCVTLCKRCHCRVDNKHHKNKESKKLKNYLKNNR